MKNAGLCIHFPSQWACGLFPIFVFKLILQWAYFIFSCVCGRVTPGGIYQSGDCFPKLLCKLHFYVAQKYLNPIWGTSGLHLSRNGMTFYSGSVSFLVFHKSMSTPALLSIKVKRELWQKPYVRLLSERTNSKSHLANV